MFGAASLKEKKETVWVKMMLRLQFSFEINWKRQILFCVEVSGAG